MDLNEALQLVNKPVRDLSAYHLEPEDVPYKLNQNENPFDWPPEIKEEMAAFCRQRPWNRYPNFVPEGLKRSVAAYVGVKAENVVVGNGSNEMLLVLMLSLLNTRAPLIICQPTFTVYSLLGRGMGATPRSVMLKDDLSYDVDALIDAARANPGALMIIASPNNPTGGALEEAAVRELLKAHRGFLILDQAYVEFGGFNAVGLFEQFPNLVVTRTFSKALGGAGLRLGYLVGASTVVEHFGKIKLPYNINFFSEHVAEVLLANTGIVAERVARIKRSRDELLGMLSSMPFDNVYPSKANFVLVRASRKDRLFDALRSKGVLVRDVSKYPMLENCLRISAGSPEENRALESALKAFFS